LPRRRAIQRSETAVARVENGLLRSAEHELSVMPRIIPNDLAETWTGLENLGEGDALQWTPMTAHKFASPPAAFHISCSNSSHPSSNMYKQIAQEIIK
jgi:hypothetical protein